MSSSHPPTLIRLVTRCLQQECALFRAPAAGPAPVGVLAAVSGGPDSMALLHVLSLLAPKLGFRVFACGVDHGLRAAAADELDLAERAAGRWSVPFVRREVQVAPGSNLQARAREARYRALRGVAAECGAEFIATAHHLDDRAETVLLRLLRGSGPRGLAVLPPRSGDLLRPMIRARRQDVELHLARHQIPFSQDPSNHDPRFLRTRVRKELVPLLQELSPGVMKHLAALADQLDVHEELGGSGSTDSQWLVNPVVDGVPLNREQAAQLRVARLGIHVPLSQERELVFDAATGQPRVRPRSVRVATTSEETNE